jgi:YD repeat-containing protein
VIPRPDGVSSNDSAAEAKPKVGASPLLDNIHAEAIDALAARSAKSGSVNDGVAGTKSGAGTVPRPEGTPTAVIGYDGSIHFVGDSPVGNQTPENAIDRQGRVTKVSYPDQSSTQFSYNDGKLDKIRLRDGEVVCVLRPRWTRAPIPLRSKFLLNNILPFRSRAIHFTANGTTRLLQVSAKCKLYFATGP